MDRRNIERVIRRIKVGGKAGAQANARKYTKWAGWSVLIVIGLIVSSMAFTGRQAGKSLGPSTTSVDSPPGDVLIYQAADGLAANKVVGLESKAMTAPEIQAQTGGAASAQPRPWDRMLIRTATLRLTVKDVSSGVDRVRLLALNHGGYVFQLDSHEEGDYTVSSIVIQVPSQEFDRIMPELRKLDGQVKKIDAENVSSSDVTEEYTDLQSQLRNLQATEGRLLALQAKAEKLEDILALDRELRQIQAEVERIQGRVSFLSKRAEMSSITVSLYPEQALPKPIEPQAKEAWNPGETALKAWNASLEMLSVVATVVISVAVFMWWAVPLLLLAFMLVLRPRKQNATPVPPSGEPSA